jgi:superfamily I DNA/RNA helicase
MQWDMAKSIWNKTEDTFIAGDDDQAIFKWAGADVDSFIALQNQMINLPLTQSFRIPAKVHGLAMGIINRIRNRIDKNWQPKTNEGSLHRHFDIDSVDMSTGEWLVLARTRHMLKDVEDSLYRKGFYYEYMTDKNFSKQKIKGMAKEGMYDMDTLKKHYDLKTSDEWYRAFDDAGQTRVNYLRKMRANGEFLNKKPRIELSTIHAAKGGEAQNVVLLTDLTQTTMNTYERNPDDENRLFYVGATRTKENLHIVEPKRANKGYII